ncbi:MAG: putative toxin-antitoxin system toxin component, PIN family [Actinobacteria bacterium]|nr:putative toxin-antitoxin system toxin component, PIN family [Actinomycetota bacterium]
MINIVLDTNVIVAAFVARGLSNAVFELCLDRFEVIISKFIINETSKILKDKIKIPEERITEIIEFLKESCRMATYESLSQRVCRDKNDDEILALAKDSKSKYIITGDQDLLVLNKFEDIKIVSPRQLWEITRDISFYDLH